MALASAKQLLDELMGRDRNLDPTNKKKEIGWKLPDVCKYFLVKFCPNELFVNTKADLGPCNKIHDENLRREFQRSTHYDKINYEDEFLRYCQNMLSDVEKRIRRAKQRLALGHLEGGIPAPPGLRNNEEKALILTNKINNLLIQVEQLGCEGKVEEAQGVMKLCEKLKEEREELCKTSESNHWLQQTAEIAAAQEKQMEVCDVCGAFLIVGDAQQRVDDHLTGKQHVGYAKVKAAVEEILEMRDKTREEKEKQRDKEIEDRKRQRDDEDRRSKRVDDDRRREPDQERDRDRYRRRERSRDRKHSRSSRSRSRERTRNFQPGRQREWERDIRKPRYVPSSEFAHSDSMSHYSRRSGGRMHDQRKYRERNHRDSERRSSRSSGERYQSSNHSDRHRTKHTYEDNNPSDDGEHNEKEKIRNKSKDLSSEDSSNSSEDGEEV